MNGKDLHFSKRKMRKFRYNAQCHLGRRKRTYLSKSELVDIIEKAFYPCGLLELKGNYLKKTHRQLMNIILNTERLKKKYKEEAIIWDEKVMMEQYKDFPIIGFACPAIEDPGRIFPLVVECGGRSHSKTQRLLNRLCIADIPEQQKLQLIGKIFADAENVAEAIENKIMNSNRKEK